MRGDPEDVFSRGHVCPKALGMKELLDDPDRVRQPLRRTASGFEPVSWDEALTEIAARLRAIRSEHGKNAVALYVGNPVVHSHRSGLASQLLTHALGTENRFDPNSQDSNPRLVACREVYGDPLSMPVPDIERATYVLLLGANPAASNGSQLGLGDPKARFRAVRERGGRLVVVDPRRTETAAWCDEHVFIRPGGDAALLLATLNVVFARGVDEALLDELTNGWRELRGIARRFPPERVGAAIGVPSSVIRRLATELASRRGVVYARVGVCQNEFGPVASWLAEALNVVTGAFDRPGGVMFPTPAADIGPLARVLGHHAGRWRSRVRGLPEFLGSLPSAVMAEEMETPGEGQVRALLCLAGNPVLSTPNGPRLAKAIAGLELTVAIDFYVNETSRLAHFVLPPKHVFETGNFDVILSRFAVRNHAKYSPPITTTDDDTRDDWDVAVELASRVLFGRPPPASVARWMHRAPERFVELLLSRGAHGLSLEALAKAEHGVDLGPLVPSGRAAIATPSGRIELTPEIFVRDLPRLERWLDERPANGLVLIGRRHLRSNNSWMHNLPVLAKGPDRARLLVHPDDAARIGGATGARVEVSSRTGTIEATIEVSADVMPGVVSLPHGFGHADANATLSVAGALPGASANALTDELFVEPIVGTSILNGVPVTLELTELPPIS